MRDAELRAEERAEQVELDGAPEFLFRRFGDRAVGGRRAAGIVVQDIEPAVAPDGLGEGRLDVCAVGDVAAHEMGVAARIAAARAGGLRGRFAGRRVDLGDDDLGAFLGKAFGGGAADAGARRP